MSKKYILRSKWFLSMAVLLLFATANAQEITKEKKPDRFGIGIAYGFKDRVKELIHPIELTVRYNLSEKHSFYVNVPLGWKSWRDDYASVDPVIRGYYTHKMRLYGLGIGYDYSIVSYKNLDLLAGGGLEYQRFYNRYQEVQEGEPFPFQRDRFNDYSLYPKVGLRYTWRFVGVEFDYRCYFSVRGLDNYSEQFSELPREVDYDTHIDHAFRCGVYFLF